MLVYSNIIFLLIISSLIIIKYYFVKKSKLGNVNTILIVFLSKYRFELKLCVQIFRLYVTHQRFFNERAILFVFLQFDAYNNIRNYKIFKF